MARPNHRASRFGATLLSPSLRARSRVQFRRRLLFESLEDRRLLSVAIGDLVWKDLNANGLQDGGEPGVAGVAVEVFSSTDATIGNADDVSYGQAGTDAAGHYAFAALPDGLAYYEVFHAPVGYTFVTQAAGSNRTIDSDPSASGVTGLFTVTAGQSDTSHDAGLVGAAPGFGWALGAGGASGDYGKAIACDSAGNSYVTGVYAGTADFDSGPGTYNLTSAGGDDVFVAKYTSAGALVWARGFGGTNADAATGVTVAGDGSVLTTGYFSGTADFDPGLGAYSLTSTGGTDVFVSKLDALGNFVWARSLGGTMDDHGKGIAVATDGAVYTTGDFTGTADFAPGPGVYNLTSDSSFYSNAFVSKLDASGNFVWARGWGGTSTTDGKGIAVAADGSVYTTGYCYSNTADFDPGPGMYNLTGANQIGVFISKLDAAGNFVWARALSAATLSDQGSGNAIAVAADGSVYTTGSLWGTVDFDPGPGTYNLTSHAGKNDGFLSKLDASGNFVWARSWGGTSSVSGSGIAVGSDGAVYSAGYFVTGTADFDPGPGTFELISAGSAGNNKAFVSKLDASGNFVWARGWGGTSVSCYNNGMALAADGAFYTTGGFNGTADFDPGPGTYNLTSAGTGDMFVSRHIQPQAPTAITLSDNRVVEGQAAGIPVVLLQATDPDVNESFTYALVAGDGSTDNASFTVVANVLRTAATFNFQAKSSYNIRLRVTDYAGLTLERTFPIQVVAATDLGSIGDRVWRDSNSNGIQDAGESGVAGVGVEVISASDSLSRGQTVTDANGNYTLGSLLDGVNYTLTFRAPVGYTFTAQNVGSNRAVDSDADAAGRAGPFVLTAGQSDTSHDAGLLGAATGFGWAISVDGASAEGWAITRDAAGNVYVIGAFNGTVDFDPGPGTYSLTSTGGYDDFVAKYTSAGALFWARGFGGTSSDSGRGIAAAVDGSVYATGSFQGTVDFDPGPGTYNLTSGGSSSGDIFVTKLDASGNFVWARGLGGVYSDSGNGIAVSSDGSVYTTGSFNGTVDFDPGPGINNLTSAGSGSSDVFVWKLDASGNFVWARGLGGTSSDAGNGIAVSSDGSVYTTGSFYGTADFDPGVGTYSLTSAGSTDIFVSKLDASGNFVWARRLGGTSPDCGNGVAVSSDGSVYTTGGFQGTADFDPGVGTYSLTSAGSTDIFVSKLDASGNFVWTRRLGGTSGDYGYGIAVSADGSVYTSGYFAGTVDFDPGVGTYNLTSAGYMDIFVWKLDALGSFVWARSLGGTNEAWGYAIAVSADGAVYTTGYFLDTVDFDPGSGTYNLTTTGYSDAFVSKLFQLVVGDRVWNDQNGNGIQDAGEASLAGVTVDLKTSTDTVIGNGDDALQYKAVTDANGQYTIGVALAAGTRYYLVVHAPNGRAFTSQDQGSDDSQDSDANASGFTTLFTFTPGQVRTDIDAGLTSTNTAPTDLALSASSVAENQSSGTVVGTFSTTDPDAGNTFTYTLVAGTGSTDNGSFTINASGQLLTAAAFNYEAKSSYAIRVRTTDQGGLWYEKQIAISVTNVNETPTDLALSTSSVAEHQSSGTTVGTFSTTDPDAGNTFIYTLVAGTGSTDNGSFTINGAGQLLTAAAFNYETKSSYAIRVRTTDQGGLWYEKQFTISVTNVNETPTDLALSASSISENQSSGTAIGTFSTTDPDAVNTFTYTLVAGAGSTDNGSFTVDAGGQLLTAAAFNYEAKSSYEIRVRTTDQGGLWLEQPLTVTVLDVNEAPTDLSIPSTSVAENQPSGTAVGTLSTSDPDGGNTFVYSLVAGDGGTDNGSFTIDTGGRLLTAAVFNYESRSSYEIRVRTTDPGGLWCEKPLTISVTSVNEAPTDLALAPSSVAEDQPGGTVVGAFSTTDPNSGDTFTYSLVSGTGSTNNGSFTIDGAGQLLTAAVFNYEAKSSYAIRVRTTDQGGLWFEKEFTLGVTNVNEAPTDLALSPSSVAENRPVGTTVGLFSSTDPDASNTFTSTLVSGSGSTDNGLFTIDGGGHLLTAAAFNYEAKLSCAIRVRTTDQGGLWFEKEFTIGVTNVNEAPTDLGLSSSSVAENRLVGTTVGLFSSTDPDASNTFTSTLVSGGGSTDNDLFTIDGGGHLLTAAVFNYEAKSSYAVRVRTTDQGGLWFEKEFTIGVTNVNEAPIDVAVAPSGVAEHQASGTPVGTFWTTDPDAGNTFTYSLVPGTGSTDNAAFTIDDSGQLLTAATFNYEARSSYSIRVRTTDQGGLWYEEPLTIAVTNVNETPTGLALSPSSVAEHQPVGTIVGTLATTDPDPGDSFTCSLVGGTGGTDNASFTIDGQGRLLTAAAFDYETKTTYSIRVQTADAGGLTYQKQFTVTVIDIDEIPPTVTGTVPSLAGGILPGGTTAIQVQFSETVSGASVAANYQLQTPGLDGLLGTSDDVTIAISAVYSGTKATLSFATLTANSYRLTVRDAITDATGNKLDGDGNGAAGGDWVRDFAVLLPSAPVIQGVTTDTGSSASDGISTDPTLIISGTADAGTTVTLYRGGASWGTAVADGVGQWTVDARATALADGSYLLTAQATSAAGTGTLSAAFPVKIDTLPPVVTVDRLLTRSPTPVLGGTVSDPGGAASGLHDVSVVVGGQTLTAAVNGGRWSVAIPSALADGRYSVTATATDMAGNAATDGTTNELCIDTTGPAVTIVSMVRNNNQPLITGRADDPAPTSDIAAVTVLVGGQTLAATVSGSGWYLTVPSPLADGIYDVVATATDAAGNSASDATTSELIVDTVRPVVTINTLATRNTTPTLTGTVSDAAPSGGVASVRVEVGNQTLTATVSSGTWSVTVPTALAEGSYDVSATATDAAGNSSQDHTAWELKIDRVAPVVTVTSLVTNSKRPLLAGTVSDAAPSSGVTGVTVLVGGQTLTATVSGNAWTVTVPGSLTDQTYNVTATATDAASNSASDGTTGELTVDTVAPVVTVAALLTTNLTPTLTGTVNDGANSSGVSSVTVRVNGQMGGALLVAPCAGGLWSVAVPAPLPTGTYDVTATTADAAGNFGIDSTTNELTLVTTLHPLPLVNFDVDMETVSESRGLLNVTATLSEPQSTIIQVPLLLRGSAAPQVDYYLPDGSSLSFPAGVTTASVRVVIVDDTAYESTETVQLVMDTPVGAKLGSVFTHAITVTDNDLPDVTFTTSSQTAEEGSGATVSATVTVRLNAWVNYPVVVPLVFSGTATVHDDYSFSPLPQIEIPAGCQTGSKTFFIVDDALPEPTETLVIQLGAMSGAVASTQPGAINSHTIFIPQNDAPTVSFTSAYRRVYEHAGTMEVTARLSSPFYADVNVPLSSTGTATAGLDYTLSNTKFAFAAGQTTATLNVNVVDDWLAEPTESLCLLMGTPSGGAMLGVTTRFTLDITDNDRPTVSFHSESQTVWEDAGTVTLWASLSNPSVSEISVPLEVTGGTETRYSLPANPRFVFAPGSREAQLTLTIADDTVNEPNTSVSFRLGYSFEYPLGLATQTVYIQDDDPLVSVTGSRQAVYENDANGRDVHGNAIRGDTRIREHSDHRLWQRAPLPITA